VCRKALTTEELVRCRLRAAGLPDPARDTHGNVHECIRILVRGSRPLAQASAGAVLRRYFFVDSSDLSDTLALDSLWLSVSMPARGFRLEHRGQREVFTSAANWDLG
jgi:hypothetical protein